MEQQPLVSVLMTAFNREKYIAEAIESVLGSSYTNFELIIVDDASNDNTIGIAESYQDKDLRVRVYSNEKNLGDYSNRNKAASYANGIYLKYLDADDLIYKYSLTYMVDAMEFFPEAAMGLSSIIYDDVAPYPQISKPIQTYQSEFLGKSILTCGPSAAIIRKTIFDYYGGFSGKQYIGDYELWLKIAAKHNIIKLQPSLIWWRQHPEQQMVQERNDFTIENTRFKHSLQTLMESKHFFDNENFIAAKKKFKNNYARNIMRKGFRNKEYSKAFKLWKMSDLTFMEMLSALK